MKKVLHVSDLFEDKKEEKALKPIEFVAGLCSSGWAFPNYSPIDFEKVIYLGKCPSNGDMFCTYDSTGTIRIYRGHLNDGIIE